MKVNEPIEVDSSDGPMFDRSAFSLRGTVFDFFCRQREAQPKKGRIIFMFLEAI